MNFFMLINVKMRTTVSILIFLDDKYNFREVKSKRNIYVSAI